MDKFVKVGEYIINLELVRYIYKMEQRLSRICFEQGDYVEVFTSDVDAMFKGIGYQMIQEMKPKISIGCCYRLGGNK